MESSFSAQVERNRRDLENLWVGVARVAGGGSAARAAEALGPAKFRDEVFSAFVPPRRA